LNKAAQARAGIIKMIAEDPTIILITRKALIDNGFGGFIEDPQGQSVSYKYRVSISHEKSTVASPSATSVGVSTNLKKMMTMDYRSTIREGDLFSIVNTRAMNLPYTAVSMLDNNNETPSYFKVGKIDPLTEEGIIIGYQAPIMEPGT
jgi:hypothetical protein